MRKSLLIGLALIVTFTLSPIVPFALAQNAGQGYDSSSLEETLKLAKEKVDRSINPVTRPITPLFENPLLIIIPTIIACGGISFAVLRKSRKISLNKSKNGI